MTDMLIPAAQYVRMSTDRQEYSIDNQAQAIQEYANAHGFRIVTTYSDAGRSGVSLIRRTGLKQLLADVVGGVAQFKAVLVFDVSRWGRFQDTDEAAHYEYLCKSAGVPVHYCGETFTNNCALPNLIMKALKRTMASEYSRELGLKVHAGLNRLASLGYKPGGRALYGMRRQLLKPDGTPKQILELGERKSLLTERVVYVPGPKPECDVVRRIFREFALERRSLRSIASRLNLEAIPYVNGGTWDVNSISRTLRHTPYMGIQVWGCGTERLYTKRQPLPREDWVFAQLPGEPIVPKELFEKAQVRIANLTCNLSEEEMLRRLRVVYAEYGRLTTKIIQESRVCPSMGTYARRFGSIRNAYVRLGLNTPQQANESLSSKQLRDLARYTMMQQVLDTFPGQLELVRKNKRFRMKFRVRRTSLLISFVTARRLERKRTECAWVVQIPYRERNHLTLLALLDVDKQIKEYWVLPDAKYKGIGVHFSVTSQWLQRGKRLHEVSGLLEIARKVRRRPATTPKPDPRGFTRPGQC